ncbi:epoxide hydrolase family protein [Glycomyces algeriensis]|uniref:epoxide hydrolase family protein n=1 Tax=Glycomyces algeriensis TaxID=256037 RepID=UPI0022D50105|nr:epoxide hydrolase family protein [Glycomyces algeriensis]MDA1365628.1 epoxide hydrolase [Glycomyces algeriensis]MDR7351316.1 pimeloyl-ACP methyl ester carboxylesterase [Glycomyces algeriensis]
MKAELGGDPRPWRLDVDQSVLDDLGERLRRTRFAPDLPARDCGVPAARVRALVDHWRGSYDWRRHEAALNAFPQFLIRIDGIDVHFIHVRSPAPRAFPLILTHGWPMSVVEYLDVIDLLTANEPDEGTGFDLVIPSIPGFGFSGPIREPGWDRQRIARAWAALMHRLGYRRYGAHGNDVGGMIALELGRADPDHVAAVHVTQTFSLPSADRSELAGLSEADRARLDRSERYLRESGAYLALQGTRPQTLAHALSDSPAGQLAWGLQLFDESVGDDYLLTNTMIYWLTSTAGSSALTGYFEPRQANRPAEPTTVPLGVSVFDGDMFQSVRPLAERDHANIVAWNRHRTGGHHPAHQVPRILVQDMRRFFTGFASTPQSPRP